MSPGALIGLERPFAPYATSGTVAAAADACAAPANAIVAENCQAGNPKSEWDIAGGGDTSIQGFATNISVNRGETVRFKVATDALSYRLDIYRLGYYGGAGARKIASVLNIPGQTQPGCVSDPATASGRQRLSSLLFA